jgi:hypothetical protein
MKVRQKVAYTENKMVHQNEYVLVKFDNNWADEFDIKGFVALSKEKWDEYKRKIKETFGENEFNWYFGTNEDLIFEEGAVSYLKSFSESKISKSEFDFLKKKFAHAKDSMVKYGTIPFYSDEDLEDMKQRNS